MLPFEFRISRSARDKYQLEQGLFSTDGDVISADLAAARKFAWQMSTTTQSPVPVSDIIALGLIDEIQHILIRKYEEENKLFVEGAYQRVEEKIGKASLQKLQLTFLEEFPPTPVKHPDPISLTVHLNRPGIAAVELEEMFLLHITNLNPAAKRYAELFSEADLLKSRYYSTAIRIFSDFFEPEIKTGARKNVETLIDLLRKPALVSPDSLTGQLEYLFQRWGHLLGDVLVNRLLRSLDLMKEEAKSSTGTGGASGETPVLEFNGGKPEYENFSQDLDWMPNLVLIARNSYVWLDQLSRRYQRSIKTLDQIPDEELDQLARSGITGLWLIGLWERSRASMRIKQMMGNPDAVASAYSLMDYQIAEALGGWEALKDLRQRAWQRGIRLSADMVPNHMGIDSNWVMDHPDWFLSLPYSPFPNYSFSGADLSNNDRVGIYLEDHYYNKTDAAVVFKYVEHGSGRVLYIYHGNDGTSMPWNDTAQLDYLKAEVREAVIQTILHVARNFPIIRFDAAMTLANKHIHRLWFPEPGAGGAIPSRSEQGLTRARFEEFFPNEFWREVVDRVAAEVPDTLLLAEAFWLMEGYFVRTLGMHRVYNSAFMHMLRDEDNAKYRTVIKNVIEFDPQILKRFVNFMNNPDEKSAIEQFGDGDKYFGVCTLMATLPGLPMFGHGQIEGFHEKYGMEYQRAYWDEIQNEGLMRRHEQHIFPLLKRRYLFADVQHFQMYDFFTCDGHVNEDVMAYSNGVGDGISNGSSQRSLIVYHNKFAETRGWIKTSVAAMDKTSGQLRQINLGQALGLRGGDLNYTIFRDLVSGLEYIRSSRRLAEEGLYLELKAYQLHTFIDFREIEDGGGKWQTVCSDLNGSGYWSVQARFDELFSKPAPVEEEMPVKIIKRKKTKSSETKPKTVRVKKPSVSKKEAG
jgi:glycosidase